MLYDFPFYYLLPLLFFIGVMAGTIDAIAGGGGLISLPALLALGLPPQLALGTNKLQTSFGTLMATVTYYREGWISFGTIYKGLLFGCLGSVLGACLGQQLSSEILRKIMPILLFLILVYTIFSPKLGKNENHPKMGEFIFYTAFGFLLGFYDGFFGPGTGSLWLFAMTFYLGYTLTKASAYTKVFNLKSNVIATACFAFGDNIDYRIALVMAVGQLIGGKVGATLAIKKGALLIRPLFIFIVSLTIISLIYKNYSTLIHQVLIKNAIETKVIIMTFGIIFILFILYLLWNLKWKTQSKSASADS